MQPDISAFSMPHLSQASITDEREVAQYLRILPERMTLSYGVTRYLILPERLFRLPYPTSLMLIEVPGGPPGAEAWPEARPYAIVGEAYFTTRSQTNVLSTTGGLSSEESTRNDIRSIPWKVYHRLVALPTALGI